MIVGETIGITGGAAGVILLFLIRFFQKKKCSLNMKSSNTECIIEFKCCERYSSEGNSSRGGSPDQEIPSPRKSRDLHKNKPKTRSKSHSPSKRVNSNLTPKGQLTALANSVK